ncbi:hypothetical protein A3F34_01455 [Candidatus Roizmanbacteria bacterium RIFCSPHIGHO2_12_FULL_44_10]|uniref:Cohesin domain-containing protein n=1 Tax=Candidatus Roizmanbacteria bacterium RIFCSPHIGHO2_12_FULL_44_10 TaxID=1802054 RepID=A0A1F7I620_9BACT|nr:MAG: hypothetical protein A3F34_01455 [Candidatus Roizmanbacteria bacterium RIFCSPHIGHO2_12_FULL_44_10]
MKNPAQALSYDLRDFTTLTPQIKFLLGIQLAILFILSILVGVMFSPKFKTQVQKQDSLEASLPLRTKTTDLSLSPEEMVMKLGETKTVALAMSGKPASAVDIILEYDPSLLQITNVQKGAAFDQEILNRLSSGKLQFSAARSTANDSAQNGVVFTFSLKTLRKADGTVIDFLKDETIAAESGINILGETNRTVIRIFD